MVAIIFGRDGEPNSESQNWKVLGSQIGCWKNSLDNWLALCNLVQRFGTLNRKPKNKKETEHPGVNKFIIAHTTLDRSEKQYCEHNMWPSTAPNKWSEEQNRKFTFQVSSLHNGNRLRHRLKIWNRIGKDRITNSKFFPFFNIC